MEKVRLVLCNIKIMIKYIKEKKIKLQFSVARSLQS